MGAEAKEYVILTSLTRSPRKFHLEVSQTRPRAVTDDSGISNQRGVIGYVGGI
jgi:hypothetical protein